METKLLYLNALFLSNLHKYGFWSRPQFSRKNIRLKVDKSFNITGQTHGLFRLSLGALQCLDQKDASRGNRRHARF
jgi:hypothetical protein